MTRPTRDSPASRAATTMHLLWRHTVGESPQRPRRSGLTVDAVVNGAIELADAEGLSALTMRRVAEHLGVSAMTPYSYVPGKDELLELMLDTIHLHMDTAEHVDDGWRAHAAAVADDNMALHRSHPWMLDIEILRPPLGPGTLAKYDRELRAFDGIGLDDVEMDAALTNLLALVHRAARSERLLTEETARTGIDDAAWWEEMGPLLTEAVDAAEYPLASRVGTAAGAHHGAPDDPAHTFSFGLACFLDGLAARVMDQQLPCDDTRGEVVDR